jgi:hypothetical protein
MARFAITASHAAGEQRVLGHIIRELCPYLGNFDDEDVDAAIVLMTMHSGVSLATPTTTGQQAVRFCPTEVQGQQTEEK